MCVTAVVVAAAATVGSTAASVGAAKANAAQQKLMLEQERKSIQDQREVSRIQAAEAEAQRVAEFERNRAANLAAEAASGTRSESFLQGIEAASEQALALDLANIRSGFLTQDIAAMRGIRVNRMTRQAVGISSGLQQAGAIFSGIGQLGKIGTAASAQSTPSGSTASAAPSGSSGTGRGFGGGFSRGI